jgi:hypothetical protein
MRSLAFLSLANAIATAPIHYQTTQPGTAPLQSTSIDKRSALNELAARGETLHPRILWRWCLRR